MPLYTYIYMGNSMTYLLLISNIPKQVGYVKLRGTSPSVALDEQPLVKGQNRT